MRYTEFKRKLNHLYDDNFHVQRNGIEKQNSFLSKVKLSVIFAGFAFKKVI